MATSEAVRPERLAAPGGGVQAPMRLRLRALYERYAAEHLVLARPGPVLTGAGGLPLGRIERVALEQGRLVVSGHCVAARVRLETASAAVEVATAAGAGAEGAAFRVALPYAPPAALEIEHQGSRLRVELPAFPRRTLRWGRWRLAAPFLRDLLRAAPAGLRWLRHRSLDDRIRVKRALRLDRAGELALLDSGDLRRRAAGAGGGDRGDHRAAGPQRLRPAGRGARPGPPPHRPALAAGGGRGCLDRSAGAAAAAGLGGRPQRRGAGAGGADRTCRQPGLHRLGQCRARGGAGAGRPGGAAELGCLPARRLGLAPAGAAGRPDGGQRHADVERCRDLRRAADLRAGGAGGRGRRPHRRHRPAA